MIFFRLSGYIQALVRSGRPLSNNEMTLRVTTPPFFSIGTTPVSIVLHLAIPCLIRQAELSVPSNRGPIREVRVLLGFGCEGSVVVHTCHVSSGQRSENDCSRIYIYELGREETDLRKREKIDSKRLSDEE